jgi:hypothetical protein
MSFGPAQRCDVPQQQRSEMSPLRRPVLRGVVLPTRSLTWQRRRAGTVDSVGGAIFMRGGGTGALALLLLLLLSLLLVLCHAILMLHAAC